MRQLFKAQAQQVTKAITDTFKLISESYATALAITVETQPARPKFVTRQAFKKLQNEVNDLRKEVNALKQRLAST